jgi:voltage-gated potassium channel
MYYEIRRWTYRIFAAGKGGRAGYFTDWLIMSLIAVNVLAVMLQTVDRLALEYGAAFYWFEVFSVIVFTVEYVGRVWSAVEDPEYQGIVTGRIRFASRILLIIDLLAILPFYLSAVGIVAELRFLRALRLIRLLRLLKLARYSESLAALSIVLRNKKPDLVVAVFANSMLLIVASSAMYFVEAAAQPETFTSIPQALWWGVVTLTTVGYGDVVPVTTLGRALAAITAVLGIGLFALPASILASGFIEVARNRVHECPHCGEDIHPDEIFD